MGWLNIPLDIMTITIAAIAMGIAVDDTIFIHRFEDEFKFDHDYVQAMRRAHDGIGHAMYYTTLVIVIGFQFYVIKSCSNYLFWIINSCNYDKCISCRFTTFTKIITYVLNRGEKLKIKNDSRSLLWFSFGNNEIYQETTKHY